MKLSPASSSWNSTTPTAIIGTITITAKNSRNRPRKEGTGTTENNGDAWFCGGISDEATACVWVGYPDSTTSMATLFNGGPVMGGTFPALIWASVMSAWEEIQAGHAAEKKARKAARSAKTRGAAAERRVLAPKPKATFREEGEYEADRKRKPKLRPKLKKHRKRRPKKQRPKPRRNRRRRHRGVRGMGAPARSPPSVAGPRRMRPRDEAGCRRRRSARAARPLW